MPLPRSRSIVGIAKEASRTGGTQPTAVAPTDYIPIRSIKSTDNIKYLDDLGWRGSAVENYGQIQGPIWSEVEYNGDVFPDTCGYALTGVLGDLATTGASAPFSHTMAVKNSGEAQPLSYTITDFTAVQARKWAGWQVSDVDFKFNAEGLFEYTAKGLAVASATATTPTPTYSAIPPLPSWVGNLQIATVQNIKIESGNCQISRPVTPIHSVDNTQAPYRLFAGPVKCEGSLTFIMEDETELAYYLNNTQPALSLDFSTGAAAALVQVKFNMTKCAFVVASVERGKDWVELNVNYKAIANTTDVGASGGYSPVKVTVQNAKASGTYG